MRVQTKVSFYCFPVSSFSSNRPRFLSLVSFVFFPSVLVKFIVFSFFNSLLIVSSQQGDKDLLIDLHQSFYHRIILIIDVSLFDFNAIVLYCYAFQHY